MRLLIITQKVDQNDDVLGFFHEWIKRFAERCERVEVICLYEGVHNLPENVRVHSLGKEIGVGRLGRILGLYKYLWELRAAYDSVFVHMNPEYVALAGWWWRLTGKRIVLWYTHREVDLKLRIAAFFTNVIATAAPESMRLSSRKTKVVGHGVDVARFSSSPVHPISDAPKLVSVGRITPIKDVQTMIDAVLMMRAAGTPATLTLIGAPATSADKAYELAMHERAAHDPSAVIFYGSVPNTRLQELLPQFDISLNACPTGGIDKAVLESMAAGLPVVAANEAFKPYFGDHAEQLLFEHGNAQDLANKIESLPKSDTSLQAYMREQVRRMGDVSVVIDKLVALLG